jgi:hypothetical protein
MKSMATFMKNSLRAPFLDIFNGFVAISQNCQVFEKVKGLQEKLLMAAGWP